MSYPCSREAAQDGRGDVKVRDRRMVRFPRAQLLAMEPLQPGSCTKLRDNTGNRGCCSTHRKSTFHSNTGWHVPSRAVGKGQGEEQVCKHNSGSGKITLQTQQWLWVQGEGSIPAFPGIRALQPHPASRPLPEAADGEGDTKERQGLGSSCAPLLTVHNLYKSSV